ncbi:hypothetical protein PR202_gb11860 [Eleusine coracana subsp. coracana]|uniref:FRIGIDA-like protein n=1 Tax=Eleusine coracana subsp. coracana TaxID=191504 RepID=A0AAV5EMZ2_ELECO|nr:hypothetical protein PR202_gb11860 [Eleusine coracana subsp. coracana]
MKAEAGGCVSQVKVGWSAAEVHRAAASDQAGSEARSRAAGGEVARRWGEAENVGGMLSFGYRFAAADDEGEEKEEEDGEEEEVEEEVVEEEEIEEEVDEEEIEEEEIEEEVLEEAEDDTIDEEKKEADKEMQLTSKEDRNVKEEPMVSGKVEEQNADEEMMPKKDDEAKEETGKVVHEEDKEEQEAEEEEEPPNVEPGAKNAAILPKEKTQKKVQRAPASWHKDLMAACASMDANMLLKFICCNRTALGKVLPIAMRHASDAAALAVQVVKLFLSSKKFKGTKVWNKCISLIQYVPVATPKPSAATIEQAKQVAKDWKEMIYKLECPGDLELLGAWGLLYFLMSYNIVSEFDTSEIIHLFSMVPRHKQKKNTMELCKGLGIVDRIQISAIPKEVANLWVAYHLAEHKITDSSRRGAIMAEIKALLDGYARKKKRLSKGCTSHLQTQQKKCKKDKLHKGQERLQQGQQSKALQQKIESQTRENEQQQAKNMPQEVQQQHISRQRPCTPKLPTPAVPVILNVAQIGHFGRPPYSATPGVRGAPIFALPTGAAQNIRPINPFYPHLQFYPR